MTTLSRRDFVRASAVFAAAGMLGRPAWARRADGTYFEWTQVRPGIYAGLDRAAANPAVIGGNSTFVTGAGGGALIDTKQAVLGRALRREAVPLGPVARVINTHHHADHAGGNHAFTTDLPLLAHQRCWERLKESYTQQIAQLAQKAEALATSQAPGAAAAGADAKAFAAELASIKPTAWEPTERFEKDKTLDAAGRKFELHHYGVGHTDNDVIVHLPADNLVITGDLIFHGTHAYYDRGARANSEGWIASLREVVKLCKGGTVVVPGHGPVGDVSCVTRQIEYFERHREAVAAAIKEGKPREEIAKMSLPQYADFGMKQAVPMLWGGIYDEMTKMPAEEPSVPKKSQ